MSRFETWGMNRKDPLMDEHPEDVMTDSDDEEDMFKDFEYF